MVAKRLSSVALQQYLYSLRRAKGQLHQPPEQEEALDKVMQLRQNRFVGISREGIVSLSWPASPTEDDFEVESWPRHFHSVYLLLWPLSLVVSIFFSSVSFLISSLSQSARRSWSSRIWLLSQARSLNH